MVVTVIVKVNKVYIVMTVIISTKSLIKLYVTDKTIRLTATNFVTKIVQ